ncbi:hypothetical protein A4A49_23034 [Nicotiana attenuata]|uniref:Uncharacterized protein n=1 Tax=Nicotiana attenuata TaxID=49451 RepID=A0A314KPI7_NICAT|nr:hypothetical protein A4A49_23034 [Nicotiana attenuata]
MPKNERLQLNKLWLDQTEEGSEEGELPIGATDEEESADEENDQEEQIVNKGKNIQSLGDSKSNEEGEEQGDRSQIVAEVDGGQKILSPDPSKVLPPAKPNIPVAKPTGGTELMSDPIAVQSQQMQAEKGIEKAGITDSMQPSPAAEVGGNAAKQITVAESKN